jgi:chemotaxis signal transduction protein
MVRMKYSFGETPRESNAEPEDWRYVVTFLLDQQTYALPIETIVKISEVTTLTPIAGACAPVVGMIELAGRQIPAVTMRRQPALPVSTAGAHLPLLIVQIDSMCVAIIVDQIEGVVQLPASQVNYSLRTLPGTQLSTPRGQALLVNLPDVFTPEQIKSLAQLAPVQEPSGERIA